MAVKVEAKQSCELLTMWEPIDIDAALELLSASFTYPAVRRYAVSRLKQVRIKALKGVQSM